MLEKILHGRPPRGNRLPPPMETSEILYLQEERPGQPRLRQEGLPNCAHNALSAAEPPLMSAKPSAALRTSPTDPYSLSLPLRSRHSVRHIIYRYYADLSLRQNLLFDLTYGNI